MRIVIEIDCQNDAFADSFKNKITPSSRRWELGQILEKQIVEVLARGARPRALTDRNGNTVGRYRQLKSRKK